MTAEALAVTRVPDAVYEALRESILTQREAPGSAVTEQAIADRFGVDYLAIGTDNPYTSAAAFDQKLPAGRPTRTRWEAFWPEGDPLFSPEWKQEHQVQSMAWTNWPLFTVGLVQRGYVDEEIRKIIGGNFLRVAQEVWPD